MIDDNDDDDGHQTMGMNSAPNKTALGSSTTLTK